MKYKKYGMIQSVYMKLYVCSLIIFDITFLSGCWGSSNLQQTEISSLQVINVLDKSYFDDCHIKGSINIPFDEFEQSLKKLSKNDEYVVYCSNYACTAAPYAAQLMKDAGFEQVSLLPGGIVEWYQKGLPCTGTGQLQYLKEENSVLDEDGHSDLKSVTSEQLLEKLKNYKLIE
jgi:rhodanese-related sulfurtransferase